MTTISVKSQRAYDILIEDGILAEAGRLARERLGGNTAAIITDETVDSLYGEQLFDALSAAQYRVIKFVVPCGEASKSAANYIALLSFLAASHFTRSDVIFALGGGVAGDLAGFAAATYQRGVSYVQIPTTLLAMVDSSVGGKTAIDLPEGKNLAGAFWQPGLVICDPSLLNTLAEDELRNGLAEVAKYAILSGGSLLAALENPAALPFLDIITLCVSIKRDIVEQDERESGVRKQLNLGHTVGHAVEQLSDYGISHGFAVSIGTAVIARAAEKHGMCSAEACADILSLLRSLSLPIDTDFTAAEISAAAAADKKRSGDYLSLIVPRAVGDCVIHDIPVSKLEEFIRYGLR